LEEEIYGDVMCVFKCIGFNLRSPNFMKHLYGFLIKFGLFWKFMI